MRPSLRRAAEAGDAVPERLELLPVPGAGADGVTDDPGVEPAAVAEVASHLVPDGDDVRPAVGDVIVQLGGGQPEAVVPLDRERQRRGHLLHGGAAVARVEHQGLDVEATVVQRIARVASVETAPARWAHLLERHRGLVLLVLLGSRARGTEHAGSDWDLGYLADGPLDALDLRADVVATLGTDAVDLVPLVSASAVLRRDAAVHGRVLVRRRPGAFTDFQVEAAGFWCDVEPVIREAHADVLRAAAR